MPRAVTADHQFYRDFIGFGQDHGQRASIEKLSLLRRGEKNYLGHIWEEKKDLIGDGSCCRYGFAGGPCCRPPGQAAFAAVPAAVHGSAGHVRDMSFEIKS